MLESEFTEKEIQIINSHLLSDFGPHKERVCDYSWDSALFFSRVLLESTNQLELNEVALNAEIKAYNEEHQTSVSKDFLMNHFWIRFVVGRYKIPMGILRIKEDEDWRKELNGAIDEEHLDNFQFVCSIAKKYGYEDTRKNVISIERLESIYKLFKNLFPEMPSLEYILEQYVIEKEDDKYLLEYRIIEPYSKRFLSQLLYTMLNHQNFSDDEKNVCTWLYLTRNSFCPDFYVSLPEEIAERYLKAAYSILENEGDLKDNHEPEKFYLDEHLSFCRFRDAKSLLMQDGLEDYVIDTDNLFIKWYKFFDRRKYIGVSYFDSDVRADYLKLLQSLLVGTVNSLHNFDITKLFGNRSYLLYQSLFYFERKNPAQLLKFLDHPKYGLIFLCSFLLIVEEQFNRSPKGVSVVEPFVAKAVQIFYENNLWNNDGYFQMSLFLMFILHRMYNCKHFDFYKKIFNIAKNYEKLGRMSAEQCEVLLDVYDKYSEQILTTRISEIKVCNFQYLFFIYQCSPETFKKSILDKIHTLYKESIILNTSFGYWEEWNHLDEIEWEILYDDLYEREALESFSLSILENLNLNSEETDYQKRISGPKKLRTHLKIMSIVYQRGVNSTQKKALEKCISKILNHCFEDKSRENKIAIFKSIYEQHYGAPVLQQLFPEIIIAIEHFEYSNKQSVLSVLAGCSDVKLQIKAYNLLKNEDDKKYIEEHICISENVENEIVTFDEFVNLVQDLYNSHLDNKLADSLLKKLDAAVQKRAKNDFHHSFVVNTELLKLYSAYFKNEKDSLLNYKIVNTKLDAAVKENINLIESERRYLLAILLYNEKECGKSKAIIDGLCKEHKANAKYKGLYFLMQCQGIQKVSEYENLLKSVDEVIALEKEKYQDNYYLCLAKVALLKELNCHEALYDFFKGLNIDYQQSLEFAEPVVESFIEQKKYRDAISIFRSIKNGDEKQTYKDLKSKIPWDEEIVRLSEAYKDILCLDDSSRFKVLPRAINYHENDIGLFLVNDICNCLDSLLQKIMAIKALKDLFEDYKSDLLQVALNARLKMLGYNFYEQSRSGASKSSKQAGELDLKIDLDTSSAIIEAVRCTGYDSNVASHIKKMFNYGTAKNIFINLMYYEGANFDFLQNWEIFCLKVSNNENQLYDNEYQFVSKNDISDRYKNQGIKVLKNEHQNGLIFYHIMANFNYV